jgi:NAD(P)-dependent dehydrogenase (short-subunit alcohol dehydrogenase family)
VVTGAGSGIGRAAALLFLREGASVVAGSVEPEVHCLTAAARDLAERLMTVQMDVTREDEVRRLMDAAVERFGGLDILFNNAGIEVSGAVTDTAVEAWEQVMDVNVRGVFLCSKHAIPKMLARGGGAVVNNASINGIRGNHALAAYSASKGAVVSLTRSLALDYARSNIRVNCLCPGTIGDTGMVEQKIAAAANPRDEYEALVAKHPMGRLGRAEEVARAALFLAGDEASFITGAVLPVDGGRSIR